MSSSSSHGGAVGNIVCWYLISDSNAWSDKFSKNGNGKLLSLTMDGNGWYDTFCWSVFWTGMVPITISTGNFTFLANPEGFIHNCNGIKNIYDN